MLLPTSEIDLSRFKGSLDNAITRRARRVMRRRLRSMREFAEQEIVLPSGPYEGEYFSTARNPCTGVWFDLVDSGQWRRHAATGPNQASKTLCCSVAPSLYHLFEVKENVIYGVPDLNMVADKWEVDLLPVILKSRYAELLPTKGAGSRGGSKNMSIRFKHGPTLRFMVAGGKDKSRAGFTSRVLVVTEVDAFDEKSEKSKEGDKFSQLQRRLKAYGERSVVYLENTVGLESGRTWQEYQNGTRTELYKPCPHCRQWVYPEREHLLGWQEAETEEEARQALIHCPSCGQPWTEDQRYEAATHSVPVFRGQKMEPDGRVMGAPPKTDTMSFRWSAVDNFIIPIGDAGHEEWTAINGVGKKDPAIAEIEIRQSVWAIPPESDVIEDEQLSTYGLMRRMTAEVEARQVPDWADHITVGVDVGSRLLYYKVVAWGQGAKSVVIEYGAMEVHSDIMPLEEAIDDALTRLKNEVLSKGYESEEGEVWYPILVFADSNYQRNVVVRFCEKSWAEQQLWATKQDDKVPEAMRVKNRIYWPISGFGETTDTRSTFYTPRSVGPAVVKIGEHSYLGKIIVEDVSRHVFHIDVDWWKEWLRNRLLCDPDDPNSMTFYYTASKNGHLRLAKQLTAENPVTIFVRGKGNVKKWEKHHRNNHLFDAGGYAACAAWWAGTRMEESETELPSSKAPQPAPSPGLTRPSGKSWVPRRS